MTSVIIYSALGFNAGQYLARNRCGIFKIGFPSNKSVFGAGAVQPNLCQGRWLSLCFFPIF